jgi:trehalose-6-phosphate synthase
VQGGLIGVQYRDRSVIVTMAHVSIEPDLMDRALADPKVEEVVQVRTERFAMRAPYMNVFSTQDWKQKYPDKILMCGVDTCQRLNGVALKFAAFEKMLRDYPKYVVHTLRFASDSHII